MRALARATTLTKLDVGTRDETALVGVEKTSVASLAAAVRRHRVTGAGWHTPSRAICRRSTWGHAMRQLEWEWKNLCREFGGGSQTTQGDRRRMAHTIAGDMPAIGAKKFAQQKGCSRRLGQKHVDRLVQLWKNRGIKHKTNSQPSEFPAVGQLLDGPSAGSEKQRRLRYPAMPDTGGGCDVEQIREGRRRGAE